MTEKWTSPNILEAYLAALESCENEGDGTVEELTFVSVVRTGVGPEAQEVATDDAETCRTVSRPDSSTVMKRG